MKSTLFLLFLAGITIVTHSSFSQNIDYLKNQESKFLYVKARSTACEIFYGNGDFEEIRIKARKDLKNPDSDPEESNVVLIINTILLQGWTLESVHSNGEGKPTTFLFVRE
jgi:hypothetical protein